ncbi:MAG: hypothetical protein Q8K69_11475, partial [Bacteroidota bacterium]|nr:hypothetical protein [Bacteroidota bacterium]
IGKGDTDAIFSLSVLYETKYKDYKKAEEFYQMAAEKGDIKSMINLGNLYAEVYKNYENAEKYYMKAMAIDKYMAMNSLAWMYFELKRNRLDALNYAEKAFDNEKDTCNSHTYSCILLWHNEIEKAIEISSEFLSKEKSYAEFSKDIELFLLLLLAKKQYHYVLNLFRENKFEIQDRYKPIYYALMSLIQNEFPDEIKRMGSELEETVQEILLEIENLSKDYA